MKNILFLLSIIVSANLFAITTPSSLCEQESGKNLRYLCQGFLDTDGPILNMDGKLLLGYNLSRQNIYFKNVGKETLTINYVGHFTEGDEISKPTSCSPNTREIVSIPPGGSCYPSADGDCYSMWGINQYGTKLIISDLAITSSDGTEYRFSYALENNSKPSLLLSMVKLPASAKNHY